MSCEFETNEKLMSQVIVSLTLRESFIACYQHRLLTYRKVTFSVVIRTDSPETRAELAVVRTYVENQAILEPILLYRASKCKQTKEQGSKDCLWTHIFTFL